MEARNKFDAVFVFVHISLDLRHANEVPTEATVVICSYHLSRQTTHQVQPLSLQFRKLSSDGISTWPRLRASYGSVASTASTSAALRFFEAHCLRVKSCWRWSPMSWRAWRTRQQRNPWVLSQVDRLGSEAIVDVQHLFRPAHLQMLSNILKDQQLKHPTHSETSNWTGLWRKHLSQIILKEWESWRLRRIRRHLPTIAL